MKKRPLFNDKSKPQGMVILNWLGKPKEEFTHFARAFHQVAQEAVKTLKNNPQFGLYGNRSEDFKAYPIVFLYRHCLELYTKAVIIAGSDMLRLRGMQEVSEEHLLKTHSLDSLRNHLEQVFKAYRWKWDFGVPHCKTVDDFRKIISEFQAVDAGSYAFRYPIDTKGRAILTSYFRFNLFEFCELLDGLFTTLEGAAYGAYEELQNKYRMRAEAQELEMQNTNYD